MARRVLKQDVHVIHLSDLDGVLKQNSLGVKAKSCVDAMSIEILSTEISWKTDLATWCMFLN